MKKSFMKLGSFIASFAFVVSLISANQACTMLISQPEQPKGVKALRKF